MIQNVIAKYIKYALLLALLAYIGVIATSKWHNIRVYPQKIGCVEGKEAIVVEKNIWWIVSKRIEITKENSYYNKLMKEIVNIERRSFYTKPLKEFPYWGYGSRVNFCYKSDAFYKTLMKHKKHPDEGIIYIALSKKEKLKRYLNRWYLIPLSKYQNFIYLVHMPGKMRVRAKYPKEKIDAFFSDLDSAIEEQEIINKGH